MRYDETTVQVRFNEIDAYQVVWHGHYVGWMEIGRTALAQRFGLDPFQLSQLGYQGPVVSLELKFLWPARFNDLITIRTTLEPSEAATLVFLSEMLGMDGTCLATGRTVHALTGTDGVLQFRLPPAIAPLVGELQDWCRGRTMKLLLVSANRERTPYPVFPLGLAFLAGPLEQAGHHLCVLDLCFEQNPPAALAAMLDEERPDTIIISLRNLDNVTWPDTRSYLSALRELVDVCRGRATVVLGGSGFSLMPREILAYCGADIGVVGEGEEILPKLLDCLADCGSPAGLPGVVLPGSPDVLAPCPVERIGSPDRRLFSIARYLEEGGMANIQTKRGCPFGCNYCTYPLLEGSRMRLRPVEEILAEIRSLVHDHGVDYLYFVDDIFNFPTDFAGQLCAAMAEDGLAVRWSAFINPGFITPELLATMQRAGCDAVEFGTDSGSPAMLKSMGKSFSVEDVRRASHLCAEAGIDTAHYLLFGGPGETEKSILESFRLMDELAPTAVIAMTGVRIYPGTALYRTALDEGIITPDTDLLQPVFYLSAAVREQLTELVIREAMQRRNWIVPGLEVNMSDTMLEALRRFKVRGPLWKLLKRSGRSRIAPLA